MVTAVLSTFNEVHNETFWRNLTLLESIGDVEVVIVDGGSTDGTQQKLRPRTFDSLPNSERGTRFNRGMELARGETILLVHPRSLLSQEGVEYLRTRQTVGTWGAFHHRFDWDHPLLRFTSWYSNNVRGRRRGIFYLDHCLFLDRSLLAQARFPDESVFEDTIFCAKLRAIARPKLLPYSVVTSAVRFRRNGPWKQAGLNQAAKLMFHLGLPPKWINRLYEKGLLLNSKS